MDKMAALCVVVACASNTRCGQRQTRRKWSETKRTLQPLSQARIQASYEGIAPTNLPPRSRISQDPKRSSQQITPLYNAHRNAMQSNANSCMPSAPLSRSGSPPRCCKHLPSINIYIYIYIHIQTAVAYFT